MRVRRKYIRAVVEQLLTRHAVRSAPVPVEQLGRALGVEIRLAPTEEPLSGFLLREDQAHRAIIGVNQAQHRHRQRFTIAHELGHFLLHAGQDLYVDGHAESGLKMSRRDEAASAGTNVEEIEANAFAAELLMPATFLQADLAEAIPRDRLDEEGLDRLLDQLAATYEVSKQALTYRLVNLGYIYL
jgi:Zn-dependent peptidase ImmA (M78 family)